MNGEHKILWNLAGETIHALNRLSFSLQKDSNKIVRFDPSKNTDNLGDYIIMHYCDNILHNLLGDCEYIDISVHEKPSQEDELRMKQAKYRFVCGTNLLTSHIEYWWNWQLPDGLWRKLKYRNVILLGVGWKNYEGRCSEYSKMIYRSILNPNLLHSVRDSYTEEMLKQAGIQNVINTGCPTMWSLTKEFCRTIPQGKARNVITTITDYRQDIERDNQMFEILSRNYENIYLWIQGKNDEKYFTNLKHPTNLQLIPASLTDFEYYLNHMNVDYVGTRLHAGIFALNHRVRSIIVGVDNRALEIAKDTDILVVQRKYIGTELEKWILNSWETKIHLKQENINLFKHQLKRIKNEKRTE